MNLAFRGQIQDGKTSSCAQGSGQAEKALDAFEKKEQEVVALSQHLRDTLPDSPARALVEKFVAAHALMGQKYGRF